MVSVRVLLYQYHSHQRLILIISAQLSTAYIIAFSTSGIVQSSSSQVIMGKIIASFTTPAIHILLLVLDAIIEATLVPCDHFGSILLLLSTKFQP